MTRHTICASLAIAATLCAVPASAKSIPVYDSAAISDSHRPEADTKADSYRKPGETVAFAGVKPGDSVLELLGMGGYYTRILSKIVGPKGHVYTTIPTALQTVPMFAAAIRTISADPLYSNVTILVQSTDAPSAPMPVDVVWLSDNYHDLHNPGPLSAGNIEAFNKLILQVLKPDGSFIVIDHAGAPGTGISQTNTLHRIEPGAAKEEILQAGFKFDGESNALHRPTEDYTLHSNFHDEQFIYRFRKP
jgi:predicted methyltransferase